MALEQGRYFDDSESIPPQRREEIQNRKLAEKIEYSYNHSRAAKNLLDFVNIKPSPQFSKSDLERLPITRKTDLIELQKSNLPFGGLLAGPLEEVERVFISPGPIYEFQSAGIYWFARSFYAAGFRKGDIVVNTFTYHMSPAGLLFHEGLRQCGATVVVMGTGNTDALIQAMLDIKITGFLGTPTFLMSVIRRAEEMGHNFRKNFALKKTWFTGEMLTTTLRKTFEDTYKLTTSQAYAVTEPGGAIAYECESKSGLHLDDDYIVEIVDAQTGKQLQPGEVGEIVVTPLQDKAWGLIRFGTGDMSSLITEPCPCGRTSSRISGVLGRTGDAVKVRGMFIVGKQATQAISSFKNVNKFQIIVSRQDDRDEMALHLELKDEPVDRTKLANEISERFQKMCRLKPDSIQYVEPGTIPDSYKTIEDRRKWD